MRRLLACLALLVLTAAPAAACINDGELPSHEREFRYQYRERTAPPSYSPARWLSPGAQMLIGSGLVLMTGAVVVVLNGRR
jgi:hypothetical protein